MREHINLTRLHQRPAARASIRGPVAVQTLMEPAALCVKPRVRPERECYLAHPAPERSNVLHGKTAASRRSQMSTPRSRLILTPSASLKALGQGAWLQRTTQTRVL